MSRCKTPLILLACLTIFLAQGGPIEAQTRLKNICRIKGIEENTIQGMGLVVGLKGTGDSASFLPAIRSLAQALEFMGSPIGPAGAAELKDSKNIALVMVTATIPASGARQGDEVDCFISSIGNSKSLAGGRLLLAPLHGPSADPDVGEKVVYGIAEGPLHLDDPQTPTTGRVHRGCRLEEDFQNEILIEGKLTLVIDQHHADFEVAQEIADTINESQSQGDDEAIIAKALNAVNVEVQVPSQYEENPVDFIALMMSLSTTEIRTTARVVINERAGSIVIGGDVEIGPVVVTHKNIVIETGDNLPVDRFVPVDLRGSSTVKLKALVDALNALKVPTQDIIEIIKGLERDGKLHAQLLVE